MRMAEGKSHKSDVYSDDYELALDLLREMVQLAIKKAGGVESKKGKKWKFRSVPHEQFGKTLDDVYMSFLRWGAKSDEIDDKTAHSSEVGEDDTSGEGVGGTEENFEEETAVWINVSKSFRRLESYAGWMEDSSEDLMAKGPMTADSVRKAWEMWKMKISYDSQKRLVWWFDFEAIDLKECKHISPEDSLRLFVWLSHLIMFDENAQKNG
eukprot:CAMPEP_0183323086 /NCGR_PEP_ID=MMETSP0160_2-20130417/73517_1 /TAXON_ID=2839 ORGANISM="Odontella Sinensis, Strain Grunow 1884" /NCGR_SAMPLE_ID=MMETSP0160_2 /ASSEMBLY_ACC=CAM_ASM_000250 /LENGTH=209 /DNA_ID=CAMNT_0025490393 /DNA_START=15 /DNA_END=641 /DNA_ORIENTATION=+